VSAPVTAIASLLDAENEWRVFCDQLESDIASGKAVAPYVFTKMRSKGQIILRQTNEDARAWRNLFIGERIGVIQARTGCGYELACAEAEHAANTFIDTFRERRAALDLARAASARGDS
jgi:hypothetical protein